VVALLFNDENRDKKGSSEGVPSNLGDLLSSITHFGRRAAEVKDYGSNLI
jgi:hypothetical protein